MQDQSDPTPNLQLPSERKTSRHVDRYDADKAEALETRVMSIFRQEHAVPYNCLCLYMTDDEWKTGESGKTIAQKAKMMKMESRQFKNTINLSYRKIGMMLSNLGVSRWQ